MIQSLDSVGSAPSAAAASVRHIAPDEGSAWWIMNNHQLHKLSSSDTAGAFSLWFETFGPGEGPPPHIHGREDETFIVLEGEVTFFNAEKSFFARPGSVVFVPRGQAHSFRNTGQATARMAVMVTPGGFERFFAAAAYHSDDRHSRPLPTDADVERLTQAAPAYALTFCPPA